MRPSASPERLADWILETRERLELVDLATADRFALPLTQELLSDTLGLTTVHINRTLRAMRRDGLIEHRGGTMFLLDRDRLEKLADYRPRSVDQVDNIDL